MFWRVAPILFQESHFTGFNRLFAIALRNASRSIKIEKVMMVGEGAGVLLLEYLDSALSRKANIYAEIFRLSLSCDAHHMTAPSSKGIVKVLKRAIRILNYF